MKPNLVLFLAILQICSASLFSQEERVAKEDKSRTGIPQHFPDIPMRALTYVAARSHWSFPVENAYSPRKPIRNRLEYLQFGLSIAGHKLIDGQYKASTFIKLRDQLKQISDNIEAESKKGLGKKEQAEFERAVLTQIESVLSPETQQYLWQFEIFLDGPVYYLLREDIAAELNLDETQLRSVKQAGEDAAADYQLKCDAAKKQFFISMFEQLSEKESDELEKVFSLKLKTVADVYASVPEREFPYYGQVIIPKVPPRGRDLGGQGQNAYPFPEPFIGTLVGMFSLDQTASDAPRKIRSEMPLAKLDEPKLTEIPRSYSRRMYRDTRYVPDHLFPRFVEALELLGPELSETQAKLYELMMYGTGETDGITIRPKEITFDDLPRLTPERLARKSREFGRSLLTEQKQIGMDLLLLNVGPMRMMLCEPVSKQLGLDEKRRQELIEFNAKAFLEYQFTYTRLKHEAFLAVMQGLSPSQREKVEQRTGVSIDELAKRYSVIEEFCLLRDLRLQGLEPIKNR